MERPAENPTCTLLLLQNAPLKQPRIDELGSNHSEALTTPSSIQGKGAAGCHGLMLGSTEAREDWLRGCRPCAVPDG